MLCVAWQNIVRRYDIHVDYIRISTSISWNQTSELVYTPVIPHTRYPIGGCLVWSMSYFTHFSVVDVWYGGILVWWKSFFTHSVLDVWCGGCRPIPFRMFKYAKDTNDLHSKLTHLHQNLEINYHYIMASPSNIVYTKVQTLSNNETFATGDCSYYVSANPAWGLASTL